MSAVYPSYPRQTHTVRETPRHATTHYPHTDNYLYTNTHTHIQYAYSKTLAHPYVTAYIHTYIHTVWASIQTAHTEIHRSYIQAITYTCTYIDTDKHPN